MKKLFFAIILLFGMGTMVYANDTYVVTVTVKCEYVYYGENGGLLGRQSTVDQSQTFTICAASEGAAIQEAIYQCSRMCENEGNGQYQGKATYGGETCSKYLVRRVGSTSAKKYGSC